MQNGGLAMSSPAASASSSSTAAASATAASSSSAADAASSANGVTEAHRSLFLDLVRRSNAACQSGDFDRAVALYGEALALDPANHILHSNRSAAHLKLGRFAAALADAVKARELSPQWPKVRFKK